MPQSHPAPTRTLSTKPNLEQLRKQAKQLLKSFKAGDVKAVAEVELFEHSPDRATFALADAQRVLARAYGFPSWTRLKLHVDGVNIKAFCDAVEAGDVASVRKLAKARPELVGLSPDGEEGERIALHIAVLNRDVEMTRALMESGSDARRGIWPHRAATTAHTIAVEREYDEIVAIIEQQEKRRRQEMSSPGATVSSMTDEIHKAILSENCDEAKRILDSDLSLVGACSLRGATPLHVAAWTHNPEMVSWLIDHGANVNAEAHYEIPQNIPLSQVPGKTPLDYASLSAGWSSHSGKDHFMENASKPPGLFDETVRLLRAAGARLTPRAAVATGDAEAVREMHREGNLPNEIHHLRGGLLSIAVRVNRPEIVSLLLDLGFDPDETVLGDEGTRMSWGIPLWFASMAGRHELAELLLTRGADVNGIVYACGDAMCMAADEEMTALLLKHGARLTVEMVSDRETAQAILDGKIAAQSLNLTEVTPEGLAEQMLLASSSSDPEIVRMCLSRITRQRDDSWWNYALLRASLAESVKLILDHGVDPDCGDVPGVGGFTLLHHIATDHVDDETRLVKAKLLLDAGASLTRRDPMLKSTPLGWACRWGRIELVRIYLSRGANSHEVDAEPWARPVAWARKGGHHEIVELIRTHEARE